MPSDWEDLHKFMAEVKTERILIENVTPAVDGGHFPSKAIIGDSFVVEADIFRDGILPIKATLLWRLEKSRNWSESVMTDTGNDRWHGSFPITQLGGHEFLIRAWAESEGSKTDVIESAVFRVVVDRPVARFGAWYQMFVRSQGKTPGKSGTFKDAQARLEDIKKMGFQVLYLEPIHPVGRTARKGRNNSLNAGPNDPGSPWAIGNENGGHTAIEPALGTLKDFESFVDAANELGMEIALDFAPHCSPDHPWVKQHPEWFYHRPDGTIKCHENPPYKYEDIYPLNFDSADSKRLYQALLEIFLFWIERGVKIFRVDNPHTKPVAFWEWVIHEVQKKHDGVIFLAEAFTRPKMMKALSKAGFTQSYTYFIWRNFKQEIVDYVNELSTTDMKYYFRPNFFVTTPDVLPPVLQNAGAPAFKMRLALAATLSPTYGIINGFELLENKPVPGTEEYTDSEKYEIKTRNWDQPGNIKDYISKINLIRRSNPALQALDNIYFATTDNESVLAYVKTNQDRSNVLVVVLNLDPNRAQEAKVHLPMDKMGLAWDAKFDVHELLSGSNYQWGEYNFVRVDSQKDPAQIFQLRK